MRLLIKLPTRQRPEKSLALIKQYIELASARGFVFSVCVHHDDESMLNETVAATLGSLQSLATPKNIRLQMSVHHGKTKVDAYNADPSYDDWDVQIATSDDMVPLVQDYDVIITDTLLQAFPDTKGILHFNDGFRKDLMTLPIVGRAWYDQFGYIYNPAYVSLFCDDEMQGVAKMLGQYHYDDRVIIRHEHPLHVGQPYDALMKHTESFYKRDGEIFKRRTAANFGLVQKDGKWIKP